MKRSNKSRVPEKQVPFLYESLEQVPSALKEQLRSILAQGNFSLNDFNRYISRAYELQYLNGDVYIPNYGKAKEEFLERHIAHEGAWHPKEDAESETVN